MTAGDAHSTPGATCEAHQAYNAKIKNLGLAAVAIGFIMLFAYTYMRDWPFYGLVTPLLIGIGAGIVAYTSHILNLLHRLQGQQKWVPRKTVSLPGRCMIKLVVRC